MSESELRSERHEDAGTGSCIDESPVDGGWTMNRSLVLSLSLLSATPGPWRSTTEASPTAPLPPGSLTSSDHSDGWKIQNALSAAPAAIADEATVRDWPVDLHSGDFSGGRVLRQGTNGWTCMPDIPGKAQHDPMCADETMMKWMMATFAGREPDIDRVGLSYMLLGEALADPSDMAAKKPPPGKDWYYAGPHVMVVLPDSCRSALQDVPNPLQGSADHDVTGRGAYVNAPRSSSPLWVIPVAKAGERVRAYKP
jgi:hypothetical protein